MPEMIFPGIHRFLFIVPLASGKDNLLQRTATGKVIRRDQVTANNWLIGYLSSMYIVILRYPE